MVAHHCFAYEELWVYCVAIVQGDHRQFAIRIEGWLAACVER